MSELNLLATEPVFNYKYKCDVSYCRNGIGTKSLIPYYQVSKLTYDTKTQKMNLEVVLLEDTVNILLTALQDIKTPNVNKTLIKCELQILNWEGSATVHSQEFTFTTLNYSYSLEYASEDVAKLYLELS